MYHIPYMLADLYALLYSVNTENKEQELKRGKDLFPGLYLDFEDDEEPEDKAENLRKQALGALFGG